MKLITRICLLAIIFLAGCQSPTPTYSPSTSTNTPETAGNPSPTATPVPSFTFTPVPSTAADTLAPPTTTTPNPPTSTPTVIPPTAAPETEGPFLEHTITSNSQTASGLYIEDIDGDGDQDILAASRFGTKFSWWRNDGGDPILWTEQIIDENAGSSVYVFVADMDGDSDNDVLRTFGAEIAWWSNQGGDPIAWTKQIVADELVDAHAVFAADLDDDGDLDILGTDAGANRVIWWENDLPGNASSWVEHVINDDFRYTQTAEAADLDGDGDLDVVAGAGDSNKIAWWRNDGGTPITWTRELIQSGFDWAHWVHVVDIDGDGRQDVLGAAFSDNTIAWWRNAGGDPIEWEQQKIDTNFPGALTVHAADLDNDGDMDVLGTANNSSEISWWRNNGGTPIQWEKQEIKAKTFGGAWGLHTGDLDDDGDTDIVGGGSSTILWWQNTIIGSESQAPLFAADCLAAGLPEMACTGVLGNDQWTPVIDEFHDIPMALVPAGCFAMGNENGFPEEQPVHEMCLNQPFWIDLTEVTVTQFAQFLNGQDELVESYEGWREHLNPMPPIPIQLVLEDDLWTPLPGQANHPLESVTWAGAHAYCAWREARLPTEAEWEYAARGPDSWIYPWGNELVTDNVVRIINRTIVPQVGSKPEGASWVGALDMSSSLFEWTNSLYRPYPYNLTDGRENNSDVNNLGDRVLRGSAWYHPDGMHDNLSATARFNAPPNYAAWYFGFRCAKSLSP